MIDEAIIRNYLTNMVSYIGNPHTLDAFCLMEEKEKIGKGSSYINKQVIGDIDRHIGNLKHDIDLSRDQVDKICKYLKEVCDEEKHFLHSFIKTAIDHSLYSFDGWIEGIDKKSALAGIAIIRSIIFSMHLTNIVNKDAALNMQKKKEKHKIENAKKILLEYTQDAQAVYYINRIAQPEETVSKTTIEKTLFYNISKILENSTNIKKWDRASYSNNVISNIFHTQKQYRIYEGTKKVKYKNFLLTYYKD